MRHPLGAGLSALSGLEFGVVCGEESVPCLSCGGDFWL